MTDTNQDPVAAVADRKRSMARLLIAIGLGGIFFLAALPILILNEANLAIATRALEEGKNDVIEIDGYAFRSMHNGKLVQFSGHAVAAEPLTDPDFPKVSVQALLLSRQVEMYQWEEQIEKDTETDRSSNTTTHSYDYTYQKVWSPYLADSSYFSEKEGHENPESIPYDGGSWLAKPVTVGAFTIPESLVKQLEADQYHPLTSDSAEEGFTVVDGLYYTGENYNEPQVGDVRIYFSIAPEQIVSVMGRQDGPMLQAHITNNDEALLMIQPQALSAAEMIFNARADLELDTWGFHLFGFCIMFLGVFLFLAIAGVDVEHLPFFRHWIKANPFAMALAFSLPLSVLVVSLTWLSLHPFIGLTTLSILVGISVILIPWLLRQTNKKV